tara:strand:- start:117 stop:563 length:447 start_codon:yes stop_codon:yes gene_type:complete
VNIKEQHQLNVKEIGMEHCPDCKPNMRCGNGHLYILDFGPRYIEKFPGGKKYKGHLYVGSTQKTVMQRHEDNWTKYDYRTTGAPPLIREFCDRYNPVHRYDLISKDLFRNPIILDSNDPGKLERLEGKLADNLRNRGYLVKGPTRKKS